LTITIGVAIFLFVSVGLHLAARYLLRSLRFMTDIQLLAFVIVPLTVLVLGWILALWARWAVSK
jgi:uncharacterized protein involved in cysteine biosynthesis